MEGEVERRSQDLTTLATRLTNLVENQAKVSMQSREGGREKHRICIEKL
jgi:hypothetical protein